MLPAVHGFARGDTGAAPTPSAGLGEALRTYMQQRGGPLLSPLLNKLGPMQGFAAGGAGASLPPPQAAAAAAPADAMDPRLSTMAGMTPPAAGAPMAQPGPPVVPPPVQTPPSPADAMDPNLSTMSGFPMQPMQGLPMGAPETPQTPMPSPQSTALPSGIAESAGAPAVVQALRDFLQAQQGAPAIKRPEPPPEPPQNMLADEDLMAALSAYF